MIRTWSAEPVSKRRDQLDLPLRVVPACEDGYVSVLARVRVRNERETAWERITCGARGPPEEWHVGNLLNLRLVSARSGVVWDNLCCGADIETVRVWTGRFSLFTALCTLVSYLCVGLNIAPLIEQTRNRTAGRNYTGIHRERLETLNPERC